MRQVAIEMLWGDRTKFTGLVAGIAFTAFLSTLAMAYFAGFMTRGFALVSENPSAQVWVMDPAVHSTESTIDMADSALKRVQSVTGVRVAVPLSLSDVKARLPNGRFQDFQLIGIDSASLAGAPRLQAGQAPVALRVPDSAIVDAGGTRGKLETPLRAVDRWPADGAHLEVPTRELQAGDILLVNDIRLRIVGRSHTLRRFPPRPLLYATYETARHLNASEPRHLTFILVSLQPGADAEQVARRIERRTGLRARTAQQFKMDTVHWYLVNSEDVGDMGTMLMLAMIVGFGATGILLYMFTYENLRQYAVLKAIGASRRQLLGMLALQTAISAALGCGLGLGACALFGELIRLLGLDYPFRMMWFAPATALIGVILVSSVAALISALPILRLEPSAVLARPW